jgi:ubiquinone/menaquinone biosynthesis C-methylase UbiE
VRLNAVEKLLVNNPARSMIQRRYEAPLLMRLGGRVDGGKVLEVGCGRGVGAEIILRQFGAAHVSAFDFDPDMVDQARRRLSWCLPSEIKLDVGDVTAIDAPSASFDAVFDFGIIHHVPVWQEAVAEIRRVLKPGGRFFFEEITKHALDRWSYRTFLEHPEDNRFTTAEFVGELERRGIGVGRNYVERIFGDAVIGVGRAA